MRRFAESRIRDLKKKIVLLAGARQAGKTTLSNQLGLRFSYLNLDSAEDRKLLRALQWDRQVDVVILDELHKMPRWCFAAVVTRSQGATTFTACTRSRFARFATKSMQPMLYKES